MTTVHTNNTLTDTPTQLPIPNNTRIENNHKKNTPQLTNLNNQISGINQSKIDVSQISSTEQHCIKLKSGVTGTATVTRDISGVINEIQLSLSGLFVRSKGRLSNDNISESKVFGKNFHAAHLVPDLLSIDDTSSGLLAVTTSRLYNTSDMRQKESEVVNIIKNYKGEPVSVKVTVKLEKITCDEGKGAVAMTKSRNKTTEPTRFIKRMPERIDKRLENIQLKYPQLRRIESFEADYLIKDMKIYSYRLGRDIHLGIPDRFYNSEDSDGDDTKSLGGIEEDISDITPKKISSIKKAIIEIIKKSPNCSYKELKDALINAGYDGKKVNKSTSTYLNRLVKGKILEGNRQDGYRLINSNPSKKTEVPGDSKHRV